MMSDLVEKFREVEGEVVREKGPLSFFALIRADDDLPLWDVVVSAPWIGRDLKAAMGIIVEKMDGKLSPPELSSIASIAVVEDGHSLIEAFRKFAPAISGGRVDVLGSSLNGAKLPDAHLITTRPIPRISPAVAGAATGG